MPPNDLGKRANLGLTRSVRVFSVLGTQIDGVS
jgi:hypothetical protein